MTGPAIETGQKQREPYKVPERIASATIHHAYGFSERGEYPTVVDYLLDKKYALTADLLAEGFKPKQIEDAVNAGGVNAAPVFKTRITDFYWVEEAEEALDAMAVIAQENCGGDGSSPNAPAFGDVVSLGGVLESQQLALAALTYAEHKGMVVDTGIDRGMGVGPAYVSKDSPLVTLFVSPQAE
jgi:hypothetical protein